MRLKEPQTLLIAGMLLTAAGIFLLVKLVKEINFFRRDTLEVTGDPPGSESPPEEEIPPDEVSPPEEVLPSDEETVNYDEKDGGQ